MEFPAHSVASTQQRGGISQPELSSAWIEAEMARQPHRIACLTYRDQRIWVKRPSPARPASLYHALRVIAWLHGLSVLTPAPRPGGAAGLRLEAARLITLRQRGVWVPEVLLVNDQYLCISDLPGQDLAHYMQVPGSEPVRLQVWRRGLQAILQVHQRGSYISQSFSRNMIVSPDLQAIGFIDFEDDPGLVLKTPHAQARDWLLYLLSTAVWMKKFEERHSVLIDTLAYEAPFVRSLFWGALRRLSWFRHLPEERKWGKDAWWLQAAAQLGHECLSQHRVE